MGGRAMVKKTTLLLVSCLLCVIINSTNGGILEDLVNIIDMKREPTIVCTLCNIAIGGFLSIYRDPKSSDQRTRDFAINLCAEYRLQTPKVCKGLIDSNMAAIKHILDSKTDIQADKICAIIFQAENCRTIDPADWSVDLGQKPKPIDPLPITESTATPLTVVHLTDIHYDPRYAVGADADCGEPACCRTGLTPPRDEAAKARRWGDYRGCDLPWDAVQNALEHIRSQHPQIDYIYMTGDLVDHGIWNTSKETNKDIFNKVISEIKRIFPKTPVFPSLGNHEAHPVNVFAPVSVTNESVSSRWIYEIAADLWADWLPAETRETILKGGSYTFLVRPGFRIISLNNNHCNVYNWWLLLDHVDPDGQLRWLVNVLTLAELNGEKVHLLYHIPSGNEDCFKIWSREFNRIIDRFSATVLGQFNGHSHFDEFQLFYSFVDPSQAVNVAFNGGSLTPYKDVNPNYKVYSVDPETFNVIDCDTWVYNMTAANENEENPPQWFKMYSFRKAYRLSSLSPQELHKFVHRMAVSKKLMRRYFRHYHLLGDPSLAQGCDIKCRQDLLCDTVKASSGGFKQCDEIIAEYRVKQKLRSLRGLLTGIGVKDIDDDLEDEYETNEN